MIFQTVPFQDSARTSGTLRPTATQARGEGQETPRSRFSWSGLSPPNCPKGHRPSLALQRRRACQPALPSATMADGKRPSGNRVRWTGHKKGMGAAHFVGDGQIAEAASARDRFSGLYEQHCDAVYNHCFRRVGSWSLAEEMTAATFLTAWRRRATAPETVDDALPWLLAIANNMLRNTRRAQRRYAAVLARIEQPEVVTDPAEAVAARVDAERQMAAALPILGRLPARERAVIELCVGAGLTNKQVAAALGIPAGTVKSRLSRGLSRLRRELGQQDIGE
jgi:RNA polymerase sigma factor (sigma-70 family)